MGNQLGIAPSQIFPVADYLGPGMEEKYNMNQAWVAQDF